MKKILILGAGIYQVPLIKKAREMGLYTIVVSINGNYPGFELASKVYFENTTDKKKIIEISKNEAIDGISTSGTDVALETLGAVCDELKLTGISEKAGVLATNKREMKKAFVSAEVTTAQYREVNILQDAKDAFESLKKPVMFKAVDSSGSRGIIKVDNHVQIESAFTSVMEVNRKDFIIIEEFIEGVEFGAQACVSNGEISFFMNHGDILFIGDAGVPIGHFVPYNLSDDLYNAAKLELEKSIKALHLDNCAINADFIQCGNDVYVLEVGARAGATCLPELVDIYYSVDYYRYLLELSLGLKPKFSPVKNLTPCANMLLLSDRDGEIVSFNEVPASGNIFDASLDYIVGDKVRKFNVGPDRIGQIIVKGETVTSMLSEINEITSQMDIQIK